MWHSVVPRRSLDALTPVPRHNVAKPVLLVGVSVRVWVEDGQEVVQDTGSLDNQVHLYGEQIDGPQKDPPPRCCEAESVFGTPPVKIKQNIF